MSSSSQFRSSNRDAAEIRYHLLLEYGEWPTFFKDDPMQEPLAFLQSISCEPDSLITRMVNLTDPGTRSDGQGRPPTVFCHVHKGNKYIWTWIWMDLDLLKRKQHTFHKVAVGFVNQCWQETATENHHRIFEHAVRYSYTQYGIRTCSTVFGHAVRYSYTQYVIRTCSTVFGHAVRYSDTQYGIRTILIRNAFSPE